MAPGYGKRNKSKKHNCAVCKSADNSRMVQCDHCKSWNHFECVGVSQDVENRPWSCQACTGENPTLKPSSNARASQSTSTQEVIDVEQEDDDSSIYSKASQQSGNSEAVKLQLQLLEEEQRLEQKYLQKRFEILMKAAGGAPPEKISISHPGAPAHHSSPYDVAPPETHRHSFDPLLLNRSQVAARQAIPKELPSFNGDPEEWPLFLATFENTTRMCGYTSEENLTRLQRCLGGKARESVRSQLMHPSNLNSIISTLKMLYGRPEIIVRTLIQKIQVLPAPKAEKLQTLVDLAIEVRNLVATVKACKLDDHLYNVTLLQELVDRLPPMIKLTWAVYRQNMERVTLHDFNEWLYKLGEAASTVTVTLPIGVPDKSRRHRKEDGYLHAHRESSPEQNVKSIPNQHKKPTPASYCTICSDECQSVEKCQVFLEMDKASRWTAVREGSLCRRCLKKHSGFCRRNTPCGVQGCICKHHYLLHNDRSNQTMVPKSTTTPDDSRKDFTNVHLNKHSSTVDQVLFRYVPVTLHNNGTRIRTHAFLDDGSSLTLLEEDLAQELRLEGPSSPLCLYWTAGTSRYEDASRLVSVQISGIRNEQKLLRLSDVHTVKQLKLPPQSLDFNQLVLQHHYLSGLPVDSYLNVRPGLLIGLNNIRASHVLDSREGVEGEPVASKTRLGWSVFGRTSSTKPSALYASHSSFHNCSTDDSLGGLQNAVKNFFSLENLEIVELKKLPMSREDERALEMMESSMTFRNGRYQMSLLWKYDDVRLPDSRGMALRRYDCLKRRIARDTKLADALKVKMQDYVEKGYARKLGPAEIETHRARVWYLPIFPVFNPNKPGKLRIVWDAAAAANGTSLNSVLMKGPDQLTELPGVLFKFREHLVAVGGDIREMFHQVLMNEDDQHCQRFFWCDDNNQTYPDTYMLQVMSFGATCSPSCAQFVKNKHADRFQTTYPKAVAVIKSSHYVDDMFFSVETEEEATKLAKQVHLIHSEAGFEMRNWISNSAYVLESLGAELVPEKNMDIATDIAGEKVLGMWWSTTLDVFSYKIFTKRNIEILQGGKGPSKRELLSTLMSIYDPLGLIAHFLMFLKILLQDVWRSGIDWNDPIGDKEYEKWKTWLQFLPTLETLKIPRCYRLQTSERSSNRIQLHTFVDASENGFAAVSYFRFEENGNVECSLIGAKSRVAPLKFLSIPRSELQAAIIGSRLAKSIEKGHSYKISRRFFWTDARDVLCWLNSDHRRYSMFVANRVSELLEDTNVAEWKWVPTKLNVADEATKWKRAPSLEDSSQWFCGPRYLLLPEEKWPIMPELATTNEELRPSVLHHSCGDVKWIIPPTRYTNWSKLLRMTAYIQRFPSNIRKTCYIGPVNSEELQVASNYLIQNTQREVFADEWGILKVDGKIPKSSSLYKIEPYLDEFSIMRVRGRLSACEFLDESGKHPIILPRKHRVTLLIILGIHEKYHHQMHQAVINEIRTKFYIPKIRSAYYHVRQYCQFCKNQSAKPKPPRMADLPSTRLAAYTRPFSYMGVDYFGPMEVSVGRRVEKRWGVLATCLTTRGVHIEVAHTLNTASCIMAIRNIIARRGTPIEIISDCGTNFVGASKELKQAYANVNQEQMIIAFTSADTKWSFNPPASPHMGGSWERLIQTVKRVLANVLPKQRLPSDEILRNALIEIENILNSRPLTYVPVDDEASPALTPNSFLQSSSSGCKPLILNDDTGMAVRKAWMTSQIIANSFWKRFVAEYLPEITRRTKWITSTDPLKIGDIVVVADPNSPRNCWPKGRIIATNPSTDGQIRSAVVQTVGGILTRPAVKLAVLDVGANGNDVDQGPPTAGECRVHTLCDNSPCEPTQLNKSN
ncbi:uncharacterized protein LOC129752501 [Uranotaenia lowii]|uniref:uncharacterized protein LOC129752501 n=1 Tax=Uranotaenia lowii TaxID=190385 RepID=UPI00247AFCD6|nr:uncharacterized protein LOC129752501 [Uranotaenia lowii]